MINSEPIFVDIILIFEAAVSGVLSGLLIEFPGWLQTSPGLCGFLGYNIDLFVLYDKIN